MRLTPICCKCGREMLCKKNGVLVYHPIEFPSPGPVQEQVGGFTVVNTDRLFVDSWKKGDIDFVCYGDKYRCPDCGSEVVIIYSELMMATAFSRFKQEDLKHMIPEAEEVLEIRRKTMSLYKRLRKEHYLYCQGKKPSVLKAVCKYIEARIQRKHLTAHQIYLKYGVGLTLLFKRCPEIVKLLKLENEADWKWKRK